jgi:hypothetical protein
MSAARTLVHYRPGRGGLALLREAAAQANAGALIRVVRILDTRSGFDADGPAGQLPDERVARRVAAERQALVAAVHNAGIPPCQIDVLWGEPAVTLAALIASWRPERVLGGKRLVSPRFAGNSGRAAWLAALWGRMTDGARAPDCRDAAH